MTTGVIETRRRRRGRERGVDIVTSLELIIDSQLFADGVELLDDYDPTSDVGRPRQHSTAARLLFYFSIHLFGSQRKAERMLQNPGTWNQLRTQLRRRFPDDPLLAPGALPPTRHSIRGIKTIDPEFMAKLHDALQADAITKAVEMELGVNKGTRLKPSANAILFGDGFVMRAMSSHPRGSVAIHPDTGEVVPRRCDPTARNYTTGGGERVYGNKFTHISAWTGTPNEHITFGITPTTDIAGDTEADHALNFIDSLNTHGLRFAGVNWDKAIRGDNIEAIWQRGLHPLIGTYDKTGKSTETIPLQSPKVKGVSVDLVSHRGAVSIVDYSGTPITLTPIKLKPQSQTSGKLRWYGTFEIPSGIDCDTRLWGQRIEIRINGTTPGGIKLAEHVRAVAPGSELYRELTGNRQLAETLNSNLKRNALPGVRARSYGIHRQWLDQIVEIHSRNCVGYALWRERTHTARAA